MERRGNASHRSSAEFIGRDGIHRYNLRPGFDGFVHDIKGRTLYIRFRYRQ